VKHARYSDLWNNHQRKDPQDGPAWHAGPHREYLRWYHTSTRTRIKPTLTDEHIEDAPSDSDDDIADVMSLAQARIGLWQARCTDYSVSHSHTQCSDPHDPTTTSKPEALMQSLNRNSRVPLRERCHTRFYKENRMHLTCAPGSFYTHMIDKTSVIPLQ
jgi:hypothetical protein